MGNYWDSAGADYEPPAGTYTVEISDAEAFESSDGREFAKVHLRILGGDEAGNVFEHFMGFQNRVGARIAKEALALYGVNVSKVTGGAGFVEDLQTELDGLPGHRAEVKVTHKDGYVNITVLRGLTGVSDVPANGAVGIEPAVGDTDDLPY